MGMDLTLPRDGYGLIRRDDALAAGFTDDLLRALVRSGDLHHLGYGAYCVVDDLPTPGPERDDALYRLRSLGAATYRDAEVVLSYQSAAAVHGLPCLNADQTLIHTTVANGGGVRAQRHAHRGPLDDGQIVVVDGVRVTSLVRTAVEVSCSTDFVGALTVFDGALARGASREELAAELHSRRRVGSTMVDRALRHADPLAGSVGESWCRAQLIDGGLPLPRLQVRYALPDRRDAFVDFDWDRRLVLEFDGFVKYGRLLRPGDTAGDAVLREKVRQDRIEAQGPKLIRVIWRDLVSGRVPALVRYWLRHVGLLAA